jgi:hypothetical protein
MLKETKSGEIPNNKDVEKNYVLLQVELAF